MGARFFVPGRVLTAVSNALPSERPKPRDLGRANDEYNFASRDGRNKRGKREMEFVKAEGNESLCFLLLSYFFLSSFFSFFLLLGALK